ncbi:MAG: beta-lactamase family protein [bacterium]|nr:beta-lactamase family protein [bacterium]
MRMDVKGFCMDRFQPVRNAFVANFDQGKEVGASVAVTLDGEPVVDLWAGDADPRGNPWQEDTIVNVYSTTKTMAATCLLMLADRGEVDLDAPVSKYWPEFAQNGKEGVLVKHFMSHNSGVSGFDPAIKDAAQLYDWDAVCAGLAAQPPWWEPGTASGYHAMTQGYLLGEVARRVTGKSIGTFFREEIAEPLGADFHIGLDAKHDARVGELIPPEKPPASAGQMAPDSVAAKTFNSCEISGREPQTTGWRRAEIPAAGGIGNARAVARVHSALACGGEVDGVRLMSSASVERVMEEQSNGPDLVMGVPMRFGMGFGLNNTTMPISPNPRAFFWGGWGGSLAITDLDARVSIAYVMNRMEADLLGDLRGGMVAMSVYQSLAG